MRNSLYKNIATAAIAILMTVPAAAQTTRIEIIHSNDTHSAILPMSQYISDTLYAGRAGYLRRAAFLAEERKQEPQLLLFDCGDFSQGSAYYTLYKGDVEIELMNRMRYDAATIGNHEFDYGLENMARLFKKADFPIVCSNYDFTGTACEGLVKPYTVIKRKGVRVGVIGLGCPLEGMVDEQNCRDVKYLDPAESATHYAKILREKEKVDVVVCLSHLGLDEFDVCDKSVFPRTSGIDLILGAHSHTLIKDFEMITDSDSKAVPNTQNGKHGCFLGRLWIELK